MGVETEKGILIPPSACCRLSPSSACMQSGGSEGVELLALPGFPSLAHIRWGGGTTSIFKGG